MSRATRARRRRLRAMTRGRRDRRFSVDTYGTWITPHGTVTYHLIPRKWAWLNYAESAGGDRKLSPVSAA